jgi:hypothetical protein
MCEFEQRMTIKMIIQLMSMIVSLSHSLLLLYKSLITIIIITISTISVLYDARNESEPIPAKVKLAINLLFRIGIMPLCKSTIISIMIFSHFKLYLLHQHSLLRSCYCHVLFHLANIFLL